MSWLTPGPPAPVPTSPPVQLTDAITDHPLAAPRFPRATSRLPSRRRAAAAGAAALVIAAAATYAFRANHDNVAIRATATAPGYEPHELIVGYRGSAAKLIAEVDTKTTLRVTLSSHPETTPNEVLLQLPAKITPIQASRAIRKLAGVGSAVPD